MTSIDQAFAHLFHQGFRRMTEELKPFITELLAGQTPRPLVVGRRDACEMLGVSDKTYDHWVDQGLICEVDNGIRTRQVAVVELERFVTDATARPALKSVS